MVKESWKGGFKVINVGHVGQRRASRGRLENILIKRGKEYTLRMIVVWVGKSSREMKESGVQKIYGKRTTGKNG